MQMVCRKQILWHIRNLAQIIYKQHVQWWPGEVSLKDVAADIMGTALGLAAIVTYQVLQGRSPAPTTFVTGRGSLEI